MSDYGLFEAASTDGLEEQSRLREARRGLEGAIYAARLEYGDFLGAAENKNDFDTRLALVKSDLMKTVEAAGVMPVTGVMNKVIKALKPQRREAITKDLNPNPDYDGSGPCPECGSNDITQTSTGPVPRWSCNSCGAKLVGDDTKAASRRTAGWQQDYENSTELWRNGNSHVVWNEERGEWWGRVDNGISDWQDYGPFDSLEEAKSALESKPGFRAASRRTAAEWSKVDYGFEAENQTWKARDTNGNHLIVQKWLDNKPTWGVENSSGFSLNGGTADSVEEAQRKAEEASERLSFGASRKAAAEEGSCPECKGMGRVADEDGGTKTCPTCNGYGTADGSDPFAKSSGKRTADDKSSVEWFNEWDNRGNAGGASADARDPHHDRDYGDELDRDESRRRDDPSRKDASRRTAAPGEAYDPQNDWSGYLDETSPQSEPAAEKNMLPADPGLEHSTENSNDKKNFASRSLVAEMQAAWREAASIHTADDWKHDPQFRSYLADMYGTTAGLSDAQVLEAMENYTGVGYR